MAVPWNSIEAGSGLSFAVRELNDRGQIPQPL